MNRSVRSKHGDLSCWKAGNAMWLAIIGALLHVSIVLCLPSAIWAGEAQPEWRAQWERTVEAAKKEGKLVILTNRGFSAFFGEFQKKFP